MKIAPVYLILALLAAACSSKEGAAAEWPWVDGGDTPAKQDPNPSIVEKGWTNVSSDYASLPDGIEIYRGPSTLEGGRAVAYIAVADLGKISWDVWSIDDPKAEGTKDQLKTPAELYKEKSAPVILNGGYFFSEGGLNYCASVAVSGGRTLGVNLNYASRDWETFYYPTRGVFYENGGRFSCGWTYFTPSGNHYLYSAPAKNAWEKAPLQAPGASFPEKAASFEASTAIGAGPVLVHDGKVVDSWKEELFYGGGSDDKMPSERHPRSAIGYCPSRLVLFVCEGRNMTNGVPGLTTGEIAKVMKELGCTEALNLDGGGSSCLLVGGKSTIKESDGSLRPVGSAVMLKKK